MFGFFKGNLKIEKALQLAGEEFHLYPSEIIKTFTGEMKSQWRAEIRDMISRMGLNEHELTVMVSLPFLESIQNRSHFEMIQSKVHSWEKQGVIRSFIVESFNQQHDKDNLKQTQNQTEKTYGEIMETVGLSAETVINEELFTQCSDLLDSVKASLYDSDYCYWASDCHNNFDSDAQKIILELATYIVRIAYMRTARDKGSVATPVREAVQLIIGWLIIDYLNEKMLGHDLLSDSVPEYKKCFSTEILNDLTNPEEIAGILGFASMTIDKIKSLPENTIDTLTYKYLNQFLEDRTTESTAGLRFAKLYFTVTEVIG